MAGESSSSSAVAANPKPKKKRAWFCATGLPSDVIVDVGETSFHLHKFPLMSRSRKIHRMISEQKQSRKARRQHIRRENRDNSTAEIEEENEDADDLFETEEEEDAHGSGVPGYKIAFPDFPGGPGVFERAAKFCYGVKIELTAWNTAPLRCAAEYLEMTEEFSENNLIQRVEHYLSHSVLRRPSEAVKMLKSCEDLLPLADNLRIARRCIDSIVNHAASTSDTALLFGWPMNNGLTKSFADSWLDGFTILNIAMFKQLMAAMRARNVQPETIEAAAMFYARRNISGLSRRQYTSAPATTEHEQRELIEAVIISMSPMRTSGNMVTTKFLTRLLRTANILNASQEARMTLEHKIAMQLERASIEDMLIPNYTYSAETLYDVECVGRVLRCFVEYIERGEEERVEEVAKERALLQVGKMLDGYLGEVASDANLRPEKFCDLAHMLPESSRVYEDGLYHAVDIYLKAHPRLSAEDKERVFGVVDCQKLTVDACTHAAQNELLPLRAVLRVLFFEQLQLRRAINGRLASVDIDPRRHQLQHRRETSTSENMMRRRWRPVQGNQMLRLDMDSMRNRVQDLERECTSMKKAIKKIDVPVSKDITCSSSSSSDKEAATAARKSWIGKYGCKFSTQMCDSRAHAAIGSRASRMGMSP